MTSITKLEQLVGVHRILHHKPLAEHFAFHTGGPAEYYLETENLEELVKIISLARREGMPVFLLGGGSYSIVAEKGISGLVVKNNCRKFDLRSMGGRVVNGRIQTNGGIIVAESGVLTNQVVRFTIEHALSGLEFQLGLPGTIGGALATAAGFVQTRNVISDCLQQATILTPKNEVRNVGKSFFDSTAGSYIATSGSIILSATFVLNPTPKDILWERGTRAAEYRASVGNMPSTYRQIEVIPPLTSKHEKLPSVAMLLDKTNMQEAAVGGVKLGKDYHFLQNLGQGTASDVETLINNVKQAVKRSFRLDLDWRTGVVK